MARDANNEWDNTNGSDELDSTQGRWASHSTPSTITPDVYYPPLPQYTTCDD